MKRIITLLVAIFSFAFIANAEPDKESVEPTYDVTITRYVDMLNINGHYHYNVECTIKASDFWSKTVKIIVKNGNTKVYKHTYKNSHLYIFSNGQIQIGVPRLDWVVIWAKDFEGKVVGRINEKEGVY